MQFAQLYRFIMLFATGLILARMGVSTEVIGIYETLLFLSSAFSFFWLNGLLQNLLSQYHDADDKNKLLQSTFWGLSAFRLLAFIAYLLLVFQFYPEFKAEIYHQSVQLFALVILFAGAGLMAEYVFLVRNKPKLLSIFSTVHYTAHLLIVVACFAAGTGLKGAVYGLVGLNFVRLVFVWYLLFKDGFAKPDSKIIGELINHSLPLMIAALLSGSIEYISGFYVSGFLGDAEFAVYRYGAKELPLTLLLANAFSNAVIPRVAANKTNLAGSLSYIKQQSGAYIKWLIPLSVVLIPFGKYLYPILFNPDFAASALVFNIFLLAVISRFIFPQSILMGLGYKKVIMAASVIEVISCIVLMLILSPVMGIAGIATAVVGASAVEKAVLMVVLYQNEGIIPSSYINLKLLAILSVILLVAFATIQIMP